MGLFPRQLLWLLVFLRRVGKIIRIAEESKLVQFLKRNRLFSLIPIAFLSWQLAQTRGELQVTKESTSFYKSRLETYFRDWEDIDFGVWEKQKIGERYIFLGVNKAYVDNFLLPNGLLESDILGLDNIQAFGDVGREWRINDSIVAHTGRTQNTVEPAQYGKKIGWVFISKWRKLRRNGDTTVIGMAIKIDTIQKLYLKEMKSRTKDSSNEYPGG